MTFALDTQLEITGDRSLFERTSKKLRNPRTLFQRVGVLGMSSAIDRLDNVLSSDADAVRTGRLAASLRVGARGASGGEGIFDLGDDFVRVGSSTPYAAQVNFGGTIRPKRGRALAIPLTTKLKRQDISPRDIDPQRQVLSFIPSEDGRGIGVLVDEENKLGFGTAPLFALTGSVTQKPRPFLFWSEEDKNTIATELYPQWLRGE